MREVGRIASPRRLAGGRSRHRFGSHEMRTGIDAVFAGEPNSGGEGYPAPSISDEQPIVTAAPTQPLLGLQPSQSRGDGRPVDADDRCDARRG